MTIRKDTARTASFKMVDATDYATPEPSLTVTVQISMDGAAFVNATNAAVEIGAGWYSILLTGDEMRANEIIVKATAAGAAQSDRLIITSVPTPSGGGGSNHGRCAWWDEDLQKAMEFFNSFPDNFKDIMKKLNSISSSQADSGSEVSDAISSQSNMVNDEIGGVKGSVGNIQSDIQSIEKLLIQMATPEALEAYLHD